MVEFWFIRHGESEGNAGLRIPSDQENPLTSKGKLQAARVSKKINTPPDLFVTSPYIRTSQTARPTLEKFPGVPVQTWPIYEYTYLNKQQYANTTGRQRSLPALAYFLKLDPELNLGTGAESYNQFLDRVDFLFQQIRETPHNFIILFGHGWFIKALFWKMLRSKESAQQKIAFINHLIELLPCSKWGLRTAFHLEIRGKNPMLPFLLFSSSIHMPNTGIVKFNYDRESNSFSLSGFKSN